IFQITADLFGFGSHPCALPARIRRLLQVFSISITRRGQKMVYCLQAEPVNLLEGTLCTMPTTFTIPARCTLCPRRCGAARAALHFWEEPCISGTRGSGTVFFSGCALKCCYCQNYPISAQCFGKEITVERLAGIFLELQRQGAHNINLVTPGQWQPWIIAA